MEAAFAWLGQIFEAILLLVPRVVIVRATHGGVKWRYGSSVYAMKPGIHFYWPLVTDIEIIPTARQTLKLLGQFLTTKDARSVAACVAMVYRIGNIEHAIGRINWDVDTTVEDITRAAVASVLAKYTFDELLKMTGSEKLNGLLTEAAKGNLRQFGVSVSECKLTDFALSRVHRFVTDPHATKIVESE